MFSVAEILKSKEFEEELPGANFMVRRMMREKRAVDERATGTIAPATTPVAAARYLTGIFAGVDNGTIGTGDNTGTRSSEVKRHA